MSQYKSNELHSISTYAKANLAGTEFIPQAKIASDMSGVTKISSDTGVVLLGLKDTYTFQENFVNSETQLFYASDVVFNDLYANGLEGGSLTITRISDFDPHINQINAPDGTTQDQLGFLSIGIDGIQISGNNVDYKGVQIGSIVDDQGDASNLNILFNSNATTGAVEALVKSITYTNLSSSPIFSRQFEIKGVDSEGNSSPAQLISVNVTPQADGAITILSESQVNSYTEGSQKNPAIASLNGGKADYVIVWESDKQDGSQGGVFGQRFSADGEMKGAEFQVNSTVRSQQTEPQVTGLEGGGFVVTWSDNSNLSGTDKQGYGVYAQMYDATGATIGSEFQVNTETASTQNDAQITALNNGGFVVTWTSDTSGAAGDASAEGIFAQLYDAAGTKAGEEFQVNSEVSGSQHQASVAELSDGGFVISWTSATVGNDGDGSLYGVFAQRYNSTGSALGDQFQVNTETSNHQDYSVVTGLANGGFVIAWSSAGQDGSGGGIFAQRYNAVGVAVDNEFRVNESKSGDQADASITALTNGGFVITWTDENALDTSGYGVFGQQYDKNGHRVDGQFQVNSEVSGTQYQSGVTALPGGDFVVTWSSQTSGTAGDGDSYGIFQQIYNTPEPLPSFPPFVVPPVGENLPPDAVDDAFSTDEDTAISGNVLGNDTDPEGDTLNVTGNTAALSGAAVTVNADGSFDYDPTGFFDHLQVGESATDSFEYTIADGNGGSDTATVTITIEGVNDAPDAVDDAFSTDEDTAISGKVLGNDTDPEGDTLSVTGNTAALSGAAVTVNADGSFDYDPTGFFEHLQVGDSATDSFEYTISDGNGGSDTATVTITIEGVNDAPDAVDDAFSTDEDTAISGNVLGNDTDPEGDTLSVTGNTAALSGAAVTVNADGSFDYDPTGFFEHLQVGDSATDSFEYTISDGNGGSDTATVTITIEGVNDAPDAVDDAFSTDEDTAISGNVLGNDTDPEGDTLSVTGNTAALSGAAVTVNADGSFDYDPTGFFDHLQVGESATDSFEYTIADGNGGSDTATVTITIEGVNDAPDAVDDAFSTDEDTAISGNVLGNDTDPEGDTLNVTGNTAALSGAAVTVNADGSFDYDPTGFFDHLQVGDSATDSFEYTISDGNGGSDTATVTITIEGVNDAPDAVDDAFSTDEDTAISGNVLGNDTDPEGDTLSVTGNTAALSGAAVTVNADGSFDYDPTGFFEHLQVGESATDSFEYTISDGNGGSDTATVTITIEGVNDAPDAVDDAFSTDEDTAISGNVLGNDTDPEGDTLSVTGNTAALSGAAVTVNADGSFDYDPTGFFEHLQVGESATDSFEYTISDGNGGSDTATVTITIEGVNDAPDAVDDAFSTDEDTAISGNVLGNDTDPEGDTLSVTGNTAALSGAAVTVNADGSFDYDPTGFFEHLQVGDSATDSFEYTISDGNGGSDTATVTITIEGVNDAPDAVDDAFSTDEDTAISGNVLGNDTDPEGDTLSVTGNTAALSGAAVTVNADGSFDYDPTGFFEHLQVGESATDSFEYTISDGNGGSDTATVTITIEGVNDAPDAVDDAFSTDEDTAISGNVLGNDTDPEGDTLSVTGNTAALSGAAVTVNADGSFDYDPTGFFEHLQVGDSATDSFEYTISDGNGGSDTATVTITIEGVNDAPDAVDDAFSTDEDTAISGNVLGNDTDPEGDTLSVTGNTAALSGAAVTVNADGSFDYDPTGFFEHLQVGDSATDSFEYTISDGNGGSDTATVTITIEGVNDAPDAVDDAFSTDEDTAISGNVLGNDTDPEGDTLSVTGNTAALSGAAVTVNADGSFDYDPTGFFEHLQVGDSATDSFEYTISDGNGGSDTATVTITIEGVNDAPDAVDDAFSTDEDTAISGNVLGNDTDPEGDTLNVTGNTAALSGAAVTVNADGSFDYDPTGFFEHLQVGDSATDSFEYTISDGNGGSDTATVTITIEGVNDAPDAVDDAFSTDEDTAISGNVLGNDTDPEGDTLSVTGNTAALSGAAVTVNADGSFDYDPTGFFDHLQVGESATDSFEYTIADGNGGSDTATVTITIEGVNDAPDAVDDAFSTDEDTAISGNVLGNDTDPEGDTLNVTGNTAALSGAAVTVNADGSFDYDPTGFFDHLQVGDSATDSFEYTISDGNGGSDTATVTITIEGVNEAPDAQDDAFVTDEDTAISGNVLLNDTDPEGDTLSVTSNTAAMSGVAVTVNADGTFDYDPTGFFDHLQVGESATDSFEYTIDDGNGGSDTATVTITIEGVNDAPDAQDDAFVTDEDTAFSGGLFADNGHGADSDPEGDAFSVTEVQNNGNTHGISSQITLASGALLTVQTDGTFDYDPNGAYDYLQVGESDTDSFSYTIDDGNGGSDTATVNITIDGITDITSEIRLGDAPTRLTRLNKLAWEEAWSDDALAISHKADFSDNAEVYTAISITSSGSSVLAGGDIFQGDLGVSGQTIVSSSTRQEIDGTEALKFQLTVEATELTFGLTQFYSNDDDTGFSEAGRVLLLDDSDTIVKEIAFTADSLSGEQEVSIEATEGFTQVIFNAGVEDTEFVFGAYANNSGDFATSPFEDGGSIHGSEFLLDFVEFSIISAVPVTVLGTAEENFDVGILPA